jgi:hypothetical protein
MSTVVMNSMIFTSAIEVLRPRYPSPGVVVRPEGWGGGEMVINTKATSL